MILVLADCAIPNTLTKPLPCAARAPDVQEHTFANERMKRLIELRWFHEIFLRILEDRTVRTVALKEQSRTLIPRQAEASAICRSLE
jgi:hypothetical protein